MSEKDFQILVAKFPILQKIYLKILGDYQNYHLRRLELLTQCPPRERVETFLEENPELARRLSNKMIATYLQITPETYSRLRK